MTDRAPATSITVTLVFGQRFMNVADHFTGNRIFDHFVVLIPFVVDDST